MHFISILYPILMLMQRCSSYIFLALILLEVESLVLQSWWISCGNMRVAEEKCIRIYSLSGFYILKVKVVVGEEENRSGGIYVRRTRPSCLLSSKGRFYPC